MKKIIIVSIGWLICFLLVTIAWVGTYNSFAPGSDPTRYGAVAVVLCLTGLAFGLCGTSIASVLK